MPGTCDFESGLCGYTHDANAEFEWTNNTGFTRTPHTGPPGDHSNGTGSVLLLLTANLTKPTLKKRGRMRDYETSV